MKKQDRSKPIFDCAPAPGSGLLAKCLGTLAVAGLMTFAILPSAQAGVPTAGLVGYWNFDNSTLTETSGYQPAGTHDGTAVGPVAYMNGPVGKALDLRGNNAAVTINNTDPLLNAGYQGTFDSLLYTNVNGFSFAMWVKGLPNVWAPWISKYGENNSGYQVRRHGGDQYGTFTLRSSDGDDDPTGSAATFGDNAWHQVVSVYDPVQAQRLFYVDGVQQWAIYDANLNPNSAPQQYLVFGARNENASSGALTSFSPMGLDEIAIYDRPLTPGEVTGMYLPSIMASPSSVVAHTPAADTQQVTITVPDSLVATSAVDVVVTSLDPTVAVPAGAVAGSLTVHFAQGGASTASYLVHALKEGSTKFTYSSSASYVNNDGTTVTVLADLSLIGSVLFLDNFNVSADSTNLDFQIASRQSGTAAPQGYKTVAVNLSGVNTYDPTWFQVGATDADGWLRLEGVNNNSGGAGTGASAMVNHSFVEGKHFEVECDFVPYTDITAGGWCGIKILDSTGSPTFANGGDGFGLLVNPNGDCTPFDGGNSLATLPAGTFDPIGSNHVMFEVVAAGFDGSSAGHTTVILTVNGNQVGTYDFNKNYKGNYIHMYYALSSPGTINVSKFDNLKVVTAPVAFADGSVLATAVGSTSTTMGIHVPAAVLALNSVDVKVTSDNPSVSVPTGATGGVLTLHFAQGGASVQNITAMGVGMGQAHFNLSSDQIGTAGSITVSVGELVNTAAFNGSFEDAPNALWAPPGYGFINRWTPNTATTGQNGIYGANAINDFADNGITPDRNLEAFINNNGSFEQVISGLAVGSPHWLQFRYNISANSSSGLAVGNHVVTISYNGQVIGTITNNVPVEATYNKLQPYYFTNITFVPNAASGSLKFAQTVTDPDNAPVTTLIDAVSVAMRSANEIVIENPSFEASGLPASANHSFETGVNIAGWTVEPADGWGVNDNTGPYYNNGKNPDQDRALFVQGGDGKSVSQTVQGLNPAHQYKLSFAYNSRSGIAAHVVATVDAQSLLSVDAPAIGGSNPFYRANITFTPTASSAVVKFANTATGDTVMLLDDVHVIDLGVVQPALAVQQGAGHTLVISWPTSATGYVLQSSSSVNGVYSPAGLTSVVQGDQNVATDTIGAGAKFYRLSHP